jgi:hypothetical protein
MAKLKSVRCKSGIMGWQGKIKDVYASLEEYEHYCHTYNLHTKIGYRTPYDAWEANPTVRGSMSPSDYQKVEVKEKKSK